MIATIAGADAELRVAQERLVTTAGVGAIGVLGVRLGHEHMPRHRPLRCLEARAPCVAGIANDGVHAFVHAGESRRERRERTVRVDHDRGDGVGVRIPQSGAPVSRGPGPG
jgi:hypothetical protein